MPITDEGGGRQNLFPSEPQIDVIDQESSIGKRSQLIIFLGALLLIGLIGLTMTMT